MRGILSAIAMLAWALWLGGMIALFVFVQTLFNKDRGIAVQAAPQMFVVFQKYQLILAAIALVATVGWRLAAPSKSIVAAFVLMGAAACAGVAVSVWILPRMEELRKLGDSSSPEFLRLHGRSMMLYVGEVLLLLIAGVMLIVAMRARSPQGSPDSSLGRSSRIAPPSDSPA